MLRPKERVYTPRLAPYITRDCLPLPPTLLALAAPWHPLPLLHCSCRQAGDTGIAQTSKSPEGTCAAAASSLLISPPKRTQPQGPGAPAAPDVTPQRSVWPAMPDW